MDTFRIYKMIFIKTDSLTLIEIIKFVYLVHYKITYETLLCIYVDASGNVL